MAKQITVRQQAVLDCIIGFHSQNQCTPTMDEIAANFGWRSHNSAYEHVCALVRKGAIEVINGMSRGIRLPSKPRSCPHCGGVV